MRLWPVIRYLLVVIIGGFFLAPLGLGFAFLLEKPVLALALIMAGGWAVGAATARFCPKPDSVWLRYGPPGLLSIAPILCTIAVMAISDGGSAGPLAVPILLSPGFIFAFFIDIFNARAGSLPLSPLAPALYGLMYGIGFCMKESAPLAKARRVYVIVCACLVLALATSGGIMLVRRDDNFVPKNHGFAYEGGFSSTDLGKYRRANPDNVLARLSQPSSFRIDDEKRMPRLDGAEAAFPLYSAFAAACYGDVTPDFLAKGGRDPWDKIVSFTNTINAFDRLVKGRADIIFGAEPSADQKALAADMGEELVLTPIGRDAFVFFVNEQNPITSLGADQIRAIYTGNVSNWKELGGADSRILAFQRPIGSGSQTIMLRFMGDQPLREPLKEEFNSDMGGVLEKVANYYNAPNAIGYSFRFFVEGMAHSTGIRLLALNGVAPDIATIQNGSYPIVVNLYAITLKNNQKPEVAAFLRWMQGPEGQELTAKTGYIPITP